MSYYIVRPKWGGAVSEVDLGSVGIVGRKYPLPQGAEPTTVGGALKGWLAVAAILGVAFLAMKLTSRRTNPVRRRIRGKRKNPRRRRIKNADYEDREALEIGRMFHESKPPKGMVRRWIDDEQGGGYIVYVTPEQAAQLDADD